MSERLKKIATEIKVDSIVVRLEKCVHCACVSKLTAEHNLGQSYENTFYLKGSMGNQIIAFAATDNFVHVAYARFEGALRTEATSQTNWI